METAHEFLVEQARLKRLTTYTEVNAVLARRTRCRPFDFDHESERAAMGAMLGEIGRAHLPTVGALIPSIVIYLNDNDAGPGFHRIAIELGLLAAKPTADQRLTFWTGQVQSVHRYFAT